MSTVQELNMLLAEAQKELAVWQQVSILMVVKEHEQRTGDGMTEEEITAILDPLAAQLRAFNEMSDNEE